MPNAVSEHGSLSIGGIDPREMKQLARILHSPETSGDGGTGALPRLVSPEGEEMVLPEPIYRLLCNITPALRGGDEILLVPERKVLTTRQAAELLGMSRVYLKTVLDRGKIPFYYVGTHRRIRLLDVLAYRKQREGERQRQMDAILASSEDLGVYR